jgi:NAD-specific glutamate dehydrogenase
MSSEYTSAVSVLPTPGGPAHSTVVSPDFPATMSSISTSISAVRICTHALLRSVLGVERSQKVHLTALEVVKGDFSAIAEEQLLLEIEEPRMGDEQGFDVAAFDVELHGFPSTVAPKARASKCAEH